MASWSAATLAHGIPNNNWLGVIAAGKLKCNNLEQGILRNNWLVVSVDSKMKCNKLETRNTE
jgi:putative AlgH/UPF0301 family transcriptional regulator